MQNAVISAICVFCLAAPASGVAQPTTPTYELPAPSSTSFWTPFTEVPRDFVNFFSTDTARIVGAAATAAMVTHAWDDDWKAIAQTRLQPTHRFTAGNIGGGTYAQVGGAFAVYALGRATKLKPVAEVGSDLLRAQLLTQGIVHGMKVSFRRSRPDDSDRLSMPSGHTASTVATATVLQRHYGWKVGLPAYATSAYVAASRMSANKHHLTDVMVGAAVGLAAGRTVTIGTSKTRFSLGVAPTNGGAAITFTKK